MICKTAVQSLTPMLPISQRKTYRENNEQCADHGDVQVRTQWPSCCLQSQFLNFTSSTPKERGLVKRTPRGSLSVTETIPLEPTHICLHVCWKQHQLWEDGDHISVTTVHCTVRCTKMWIHVFHLTLFLVFMLCLKSMCLLKGWLLKMWVTADGSILFYSTLL